MIIICFYVTIFLAKILKEEAMEQEYIVENVGSFVPEHVFECGQCFRWNQDEDGTYVGVFGNNVVRVKKDGNSVFFRGVCEGNIAEVCQEYFDLNTDYDYIKNTLSNVDEYLKQSISYGHGIRILKQDLWETLISFIISANNNIPRIKMIIERICRKYGKKIEFENREYYTFPRPGELKNATVQDFRDLGLGFRDIRVYETVQKVLSNKINLTELEEEQNVQDLRNKLLEIPGVGPKVADCIMLFALKKYEVFPIDVWVRRVISELYFDKNEQKPQVIQKFAKEKYGNLAGLAQQYLFFWRRSIS